MSTRVRPPAKCHDVFKIFRAPAARAAYSNSPSPSSLTWPTPSSSRPYTLALLCTTWTAHESARTLRVPQSKPIHVRLHHPWSISTNLSFDLHHMPSTITSIQLLHITIQEIHQIHTALSITHHPRVTTIGPRTICLAASYRHW